jgi:lipoprotein NlpD
MFLLLLLFLVFGMRNKLLVLIFSVLISGCFSSSSNKVVIIEKSSNQQNIVKSSQISENSSSIVSRESASSGSWSLPVDATILKNFSKKQQHLGLTFNTTVDQKVRSIRDGIVAYSGDIMKSYGKMIIIKHPYGFYSSYTQNKTLIVFDGDKVKKGQVIATTSDVPFYFEMKKFKEPINPIKYLK